MAIVRRLIRKTIERVTPHTEVDCTYSIITEGNVKYLQLDTYGSEERQVRDKKSQSLRLSPEAVEQLKQIFKSERL
jgi:hypothetical protein